MQHKAKEVNTNFLSSTSSLDLSSFLENVLIGTVRKPDRLVLKELCSLVITAVLPTLQTGPGYNPLESHTSALRSSTMRAFLDPVRNIPKKGGALQCGKPLGQKIW